MADPAALLLCFVGAMLGLAGAQPAKPSGPVQCYSFQRVYSGPFDLSVSKFKTISCPHGCSEAVLSLNTGYRAGVTVVQKGCWTGPRDGHMQTNEHALPPDFSSVTGCDSNLCNHNLMSHDTVPNLSPAPSSQVLSGTECYSCVGIHEEDCTPERSRRVQCHEGQNVCFQGHGQMTVGNYSVPVFIRTCQRPSCTVKGTSSPWSSINLQGSCCRGNLCNGALVSRDAPTTPPANSASAQLTSLLALLPLGPLLAGILGNPLMLSL